MKKVKGVDGRTLKLTPKVYNFLKKEGDLVEDKLQKSYEHEKIPFFWELIKNPKGTGLILIPEDVSKDGRLKLIQISLSKKEFAETGTCTSDEISFTVDCSQVTFSVSGDYIWVFVLGKVAFGTSHHKSGWSLFLKDFKDFYRVGKSGTGKAKSTSGGSRSKSKSSKGSIKAKPKAKGKAKSKAKAKAKGKSKAKAKK